MAEKPIPPSQRTSNPISPELDQIILRCLAIEPEQRPQTANELRAGLLACPLAGEWRLADRLAWWAKYHSAPFVKPAADEASTPLATVRIDFADRIKPGS